MGRLPLVTVLAAPFPLQAGHEYRFLLEAWTATPPSDVYPERTLVGIGAVTLELVPEPMPGTLLARVGIALAARLLRPRSIR